jgi:hypothetical protein
VAAPSGSTYARSSIRLGQATHGRAEAKRGSKGIETYGERDRDLYITTEVERLATKLRAKLGGGAIPTTEPCPVSGGGASEWSRPRLR